MITEVVAALIWKGDKFMICQRPAHKARALLWEFVGGKVEPGETKEQALIRECREELAITLSVGDIFMDVTHEYPDITVHLTLFNATIAEGEPQKLEHNDIKWITPSEIPSYEFCPADKEMLCKIMKMEKNMSSKRKKNSNKNKRRTLPSSKNKHGITNKLRSWLDKHLSLVRILDIISEISNRFMVGYFVLAAILIVVPVIVSYYYLPDNVRKEISALLGTTLSVIIIPIILSAYNRKKDSEYNRFEINKELYFELTDLLLPMLLNEKCTYKDTTQIKEYIISRYNIMCVSFSSTLFSDICLLCKCCDCNSYKNAEYYAKKIIKRIRKECGNSQQFAISSLAIKLNKDKNSNND